MSDYFKGTGRLHLWGIVGGLIWGVGTISNFMASYAQMVGHVISYVLGHGAIMISSIWGVFMWKKFAGADSANRASELSRKASANDQECLPVLCSFDMNKPTVLM